MGRWDKKALSFYILISQRKKLHDICNDRRGMSQRGAELGGFDVCSQGEGEELGSPY